MTRNFENLFFVSLVLDCVGALPLLDAINIEIKPKQRFGTPTRSQILSLALYGHGENVVGLFRLVTSASKPLPWIEQ